MVVCRTMLKARNSLRYGPNSGRRRDNFPGGPCEGFVVEDGSSCGVQAGLDGLSWSCGPNHFWKWTFDRRGEVARARVENSNEESVWMLHMEKDL